MTAETWHAAMKRARQLDPDRIASAIQQSAPSGLKAARYDSDGGRTSRVPCSEEGCDDGPEPHSHHVVNDPTGNAATRGRGRDTSAGELRRLEHAAEQFVTAANGVLWWVCGDTAHTWAGVIRIDSRLLPGTIQAGIDVDHEGHLYGAISRVERAVAQVERIARENLPREPSVDDRNWTSQLADEDVCLWHLQIHRRYRRPKVGSFRGDRICSDCMALVLAGEERPPTWLLEAEVDSASKPKVWRQQLSRWLDDLGIVRSA